MLREQDDQISQECAKAVAVFSELIDQRRSKCEEYRKSTEEIEKEKAAQLSAAEEKLQSLRADHDQVMTDINARHDKKMESLNAQIQQLRQEVEAAEERLSDLKFQGTIAQSNHETQRLAMRSSLTSSHQLRMSQQRAAVYDRRAKIDVARQKIENVKVVSLDSYAVHFEAIQREIDDEIGLRSIAIEQAVAQERARRDPDIARLTEQLRELEAEILVHTSETTTTEQTAMMELTGRMAVMREKNAAELAGISAEAKKVEGYIASVKREWESLRESTQRIYQHRLHECQHQLFQIETKCEAELAQIRDKNRPTPDPTDYMEAVREEIAEAEAGHRAEEENLMRDKMAVFNARVEEERMRGNLQGLRQNADDVAALKETEAHAKDKLVQAIDEMKRLEVDIVTRLEDFKERTRERHIAEIAAYEKELSDERAALLEDVEAVKREIEESDAEFVAKRKVLEELREKIAMPESETDLAEKEQQLRAQFEAKTRELEKEKARLNGVLEGLRARHEDLKTSEAAERERAVLISQKLQSTREAYVKSTDRKRKEIEYKYKRLIEAQEIAYNKMAKAWEQEQRQAREWIRDQNEEIERINAAHQKKTAQIEAETKRQVAEVQKKLRVALAVPEDQQRARQQSELEDMRKLVESEKAGYLRAQMLKRQQLRREIEAQAYQYDSECRKITGEISHVRKQIEGVQQELIGRLKWHCPDCDRLEAEAKDTKKQIIALVQQLHEAEKEDAHRQYTVAHVGKSNQTLPHLNHIAETV
jgi:hypothetical protein